MKCFIVLGLLAAASALPDKLGRFPVRGNRQLDFGGNDNAVAAVRASTSYDATGAEGRVIETAAEPRSNYAASEASAEIIDQQPGYGRNNIDDELVVAASDLSEVTNEGTLDTVIPGTPGQDYPIFRTAPETSFSCDGRALGGYYADPESLCQSFHICGPSPEGNGRMLKYSFLCPNGTIFNQNYFICDWWFNFDCGEAGVLAESRNAELYGAREEATRRLNEERSFQGGEQRTSGSNIVETVESAPSSYTSVFSQEQEPQASEPVDTYEAEQAPASYSRVFSQ